MKNEFELFLESVDDDNREFVVSLDEYLAQNDCKCTIKSAKSGYVVSYVAADTKRTLATFVFRKSGIKLRIYAEHAAQYEGFLDDLPLTMKKEIQKASVCKRLVDPNACNPKCTMGFEFALDSVPYQKCRYMAFMPTLNEENNPYIMRFLEKEFSYRR